MLDINSLMQYYPEPLRVFKRFILREYLQCKILEIVFDGPHAEKLSFLGGTCLRLVHGNQRFSEDLDFDNFGLSEQAFAEVSDNIKDNLSKEGYEVETNQVTRGAYHCYLKFPKLLFEQGLSGHYEERILIQLDTEAQNFDFDPEWVVLNRFDIFSRIRTTPIDLLMAQKCYAILNRPRNKGRDFYDLVFLMGMDVSPRLTYLKNKLDVQSTQELKDLISAKCKLLDMDEMAADVSPFLFSSNDVKKVKFFSEYLNSFTFK
ncbi:MAG: nucleotidyl transferase AbiEii/AbiGii toxin family protein [Cryomorphaceae bacterium]|nr:nucleotidyl transferase AbiEii/AbiGii toxin family protein [Cryomorphaceae bacterium]